LTFDDGPSQGSLELSDILVQYGSRATFFHCGVHVRRNPAIARALSGAGHELGNHTDTHALLSLRSSSFIRAELMEAQHAIHDATGRNPAWFRAPYGVRWFGLRQVQRDLGLTGVMWTAIGRDWVLDGDAVCDRLVKRAASGAIFCLHDGRELRVDPDIRSTLKAVRRMVPVLIDRGFRLVTLTELLCQPISQIA
jgi:peptidoglycan/xylan/chitin deacetylase (PgdA/CDA1 family)